MRSCQKELPIKETFCSQSHPIIAPRERASPHNLLSFSSRREGFFLHATLPPEHLKKKKRGGESAPRSVTALYCFTRSGEVLHQTAGALQTAPPGPRGGHYDRDEQLEKHCKTDSGVTAGGGQDTV